MIKILLNKKNKFRLAFFIIIFIFIYTAAGFASKNIKNFKMIEFKDLYYLSKYEIIDKADVRVNNNDIVIDMDLLKKVLDEQPLVKSYKIIESSGRLSVVIQENEPVFLCGFRNGGDLLLFETDEKFRILSTGRIHAVNMPLVIVNKDDIVNNKLSKDIKSFLTLLREFNRGKLSGLLQEIDEIDLTYMRGAAIYLKGRRTLFIMTPDKENFFRLNDSAGYFDRIRYYPEVFEITSALGIIKKR